MSHYRHFSLATYFVAQGTGRAGEEQLEKDIAFFDRYLKLDKVYLEPYRGYFASAEQTEMCKRVFERHGIRVSGGLTTVHPTPEGDEKKARIFDTFCYNDPKMLDTLEKVSTFMGEHFDEFIIDDFYFTSCTCEKCRAEKDKFNAAHGIEDGSWTGYRLDLMKRVSEQYMIAPAKRVNPGMHIIIKYPNWAESYQETGYAPALQRELFDSVYTGTETRDPVNQDQHLPRYLSFSLMTYFENMCPGRNGGGWFDPFDIRITEHYTEQALLTGFAKGRELMMFCFQALLNNRFIPSLGFELDHLDRVLDYCGEPVGIMCYLPDDCRGEDNVQDYLGMAGLPVICTPYFPEKAQYILLTASSACDGDIMRKTEKYVAAGGRAIATPGFIRALQDRGLRALTSVRYEGRRITAHEFMTEKRAGPGSRMTFAACRDDIGFQVPEFSNNAAWALIKAVKGRESYGLLLRDDYGKGAFYTLNVPDEYSMLEALPRQVLTRLRAEFPVNGISLDCPSQVSIFHYDNKAFIIYPYVNSDAHPDRVRITVAGEAKALKDCLSGMCVAPMHAGDKETVFEIPSEPGRYSVWEIAENN